MQPRLLKYLVLQLIILAELFHHFLNRWVCEFVLADVDPFDVPLELDRPMDLDLLVRSNNLGSHLFALAPLECCPNLPIRNFVEDVVAKLECPDCCTGAA